MKQFGHITVLLACIAAITWNVLGPGPLHQAATVRGLKTPHPAAGIPKPEAAAGNIAPAGHARHGIQKSPISPPSFVAPAAIEGPIFSTGPDGKLRQRVLSPSGNIRRHAQSEIAGSQTPSSVTEPTELPLPNLPYPAVWVDLDTTPPLSADQQAEIQHAAEELVAKIKNSGFEPGSPEYRDLWLAAVADSDQLFKQRYGARLWLQHHVQAHHLATQPAAR